jgi:hypothetical protein
MVYRELPSRAVARCADTTSRHWQVDGTVAKRGSSGDSSWLMRCRIDGIFVRSRTANGFTNVAMKLKQQIGAAS